MQQYFYMSISKQKYRIAQLQSSNLTEAATLLTQQFLNQNQIWGLLKPTYEDTFRFMVDKTSQMLQWEEQLRQTKVIQQTSFFNLVYLNEKDEVVGVWTCYDLTQFLHKKSKVSFPAFNQLQREGASLLDCIKEEDKVPGHTIYGLFFVIAKVLMKTAVTGMFHVDACKHVGSQGFKNTVGRMSSQRLVQHSVGNGAKVLAQKHFVIDGRPLTLWFIDLPLPQKSNTNKVQKVAEKAKL